MKTLLILLLLAMGGFAAYQQKTLKTTIAEAESRVTALTAELETAKSELKVATAALGNTTTTKGRDRSGAEDAAPASQPVSTSDKTTDATGRGVVKAPATAVTGENPEETKQARLVELRGIYDSHSATMDGKLAILERNRIAAQSQLDAARANSPEFAEQGSRFDGAGGRIGAKGVRTSAADRAEMTAKYNQQIAAAQTQVSVIDAEVDRLNTERRVLQQKYEEAVAAAHADARTAARNAMGIE